MLTIVIILTTTLIACAFYQPSIHNATIEQLEDIPGIGEVLSERISLYLSENPEAELIDLLEVEGIGTGKLELLDKEWR